MARQKKTETVKADSKNQDNLINNTAASSQKEGDNSARPEEYIPQPGHKSTLSLADFTDTELCAELRRRNFSGELRYTKIVLV